jgi:transcriptional regulator with XRE-family HTH domain
MEQKPRYSHYELRKARRRTGLTLDDVKDALKLKSKSIISDWENGKRYPGTKHLYRLSALYKTPEGQLLYDLRVEATKDIAEWHKNYEAKKKKPP